MKNLKELTELAITAAYTAGEVILKVYHSPDFEIQLKDDNSPLTLADKLSNQAIIKYLESSNITVLSEEGKDVSFNERKNWDLFWLVDPLDGTKEFIKKNDEFTVNIALIHNRVPIMGVVYAPVLELMYYGNKDEGAYKITNKGQPQKLKIVRDPEIKSIVASRSHNSAETWEYINKFPGAEVISMGSSLKFMLVAENKAQIYPRFGPTMEWDTAAAHAIINAAGGQVVVYPEKKKMEYNKENLLNDWFLVSQ